MRTLLILVCTINLTMTGCKTGTKHSSCATTCGVPCGSCARVGAAAVRPAPHPPVVPEKKAEPMPVKEISHSNKIANPFTQPAAPEPKEMPVPEYAHAGNYGWLIGELQRVHAPGHEWKIRYAPLDQHDEWGGSMVLAPDVRLDEFQNGDKVYVEGEILTARPSLYLSGPLYRVRILRPASDMVRVTRK